MNYYEKYIKYKIKYKKLQEMIGGVNCNVSYDDRIGFGERMNQTQCIANKFCWEKTIDINSQPKKNTRGENIPWCYKPKEMLTSVKMHNPVQILPSIQMPLILYNNDINSCKKKYLVYMFNEIGIFKKTIGVKYEKIQKEGICSYQNYAYNKSELHMTFVTFKVDSVLNYLFQPKTPSKIAANIDIKFNSMDYLPSKTDSSRFIVAKYDIPRIFDLTNYIRQIKEMIPNHNELIKIEWKIEGNKQIKVPFGNRYTVPDTTDMPKNCNTIISYYNNMVEIIRFYIYQNNDMHISLSRVKKADDTEDFSTSLELLYDLFNKEEYHEVLHNLSINKHEVLSYL